VFLFFSCSRIRKNSGGGPSPHSRRVRLLSYGKKKYAKLDCMRIESGGASFGTENFISIA